VCGWVWVVAVGGGASAGVGGGGGGWPGRPVAQATLELQRAIAHLQSADIVVRDVVRVPGVSDVHDLHVWSIAGGMNSLSAHLQIEGDLVLSECDTLLEQLNRILATRYRITHTTIQFECANCDPRQGDLYCSISRQNRHEHEAPLDGLDAAKRDEGQLR